VAEAGTTPTVVPSTLRPVDRETARRFVNEHHRHNEAPTSWKFGVGLERDGELVGVAMAGRPSGRGLDSTYVIEITRVCVPEGSERNSCSKLYGAVCRAAKALGYRTAYTYTLAEEDAASVKAAGFVLDADLPGRPGWSTPSRPRYEENLFGERKRPTGPKRRWRREL
jgi:hypothetical protein